MRSSIITLGALASAAAAAPIFQLNDFRQSPFSFGSMQTEDNIPSELSSEQSEPIIVVEVREIEVEVVEVEPVVWLGAVEIVVPDVQNDEAPCDLDIQPDEAPSMLELPSPEVQSKLELSSPEVQSRLELPSHEAQFKMELPYHEAPSVQTNETPSEQPHQTRLELLKNWFTTGFQCIAHQLSHKPENTSFVGAIGSNVKSLVSCMRQQVSPTSSVQLDQQKLEDDAAEEVFSGDL